MTIRRARDGILWSVETAGMLIVLMFMLVYVLPMYIAYRRAVEWIRRHTGGT